MAKRIKDTDYLAISARIRAMENGLLTRERMEQVLEARTGDEAAKILQECGYPALDPARPEEMDAALAAVREETLADLAAYPLYVGFADGGQSVESREDFAALGADRIFTEALLSEIAGADTEGLEASMAGFSLSASGRPNVIFGVVDGRLAIVGMNY